MSIPIRFTCIILSALLAAAVAGGCAGSRKVTVPPSETMASPEVAAAEAAVDAATSAPAAATTGTQQVGGYTAQRALTDDDRALFVEAAKSLIGVRYTPESVATQIVAGTNYRFICTAITATQNPETYRAEVIVFKPLPGRGQVKVTSVNRL